MYITSGRRGGAYLRETYCFDPAANSWTACADGPVERAWHGMAAVNGRIYVIGGSNDKGSCRSDVLKVLGHKLAVVSSVTQTGFRDKCVRFHELQSKSQFVIMMYHKLSKRIITV